MSNLENFKKTALFEGLPEKDLKILAGHAITKNYKKNTIIVTQKDETSSLYVILEGEVRIYIDDDQGKEVILNTLSAGDSFGELALLSDSPRVASVITTSQSKIAIISKQDFMECLTNNSPISFKIIEILINRVQRLTEEVSSLALLDVYGRIARALTNNATEQDGKLSTKPLTHQEIANMVGSSREMVSKILKDLRIGGYISTNGKAIIIEKELPSGW